MKKLLTWIVGLACVGLLAFIWWNNPNHELVWFMVPVLGLFRMIGGTWNKAIGRFLPPLIIAGAYYLFLGWSWWILGIIGAYMLVKTLPFTLIGNGVPGHWINWVWIWILGLLNGIPCLTIAMPQSLVLTGVFVSLVPMCVYGVSGTLSNVKATKLYFPWKLCEFLFGASAAIPAAMLIDIAAQGALMP